MSKIGEMSTFQLVLMLVFGVAAVVAVAVFALGGILGGGSGPVTRLELWGSVEERFVRDWIKETFEENEDIKVDYKYISADSFDEELVDKISVNEGPDMVLMSQDQIFRHRNRIYNISFDSFSKSQFRNTFVQSTEVFLNDKEDSLYGLPVLIDPIVMYWNRSLLRGTGYVRPPESWGDFNGFVSDTVLKEDGIIIEPSVALGEYENVEHSRDILSTLIFQSGGGIIKEDKDGFSVVLDDKSSSQSIEPTVSALLFYTDFSNPDRSTYSWNRGFNNSLESFINEDLMVYFGRASDIVEIKDRNPLLDLGVATVPEEKERGRSVSMGEVLGLTIMRSSENIGDSFSAMTHLTSSYSLDILSDNFYGMPPARADVLSDSSGNSVYEPVFYSSAINSVSYINPISDEDMEDIFKEMVEGVVDGDMEVIEAVRGASRRMNNILRDR